MEIKARCRAVDRLSQGALQPLKHILRLVALHPFAHASMEAQSDLFLQDELRNSRIYLRQQIPGKAHEKPQRLDLIAVYCQQKLVAACIFAVDSFPPIFDFDRSVVLLPFDVGLYVKLVWN